jgi:hypothetical protein
MTSGNWIELATALAVLANTIISLLTHSKMATLETNTNSKMDTLLAAKESAAHSAGVLEGTKSEQQRIK